MTIELVEITDDNAGTVRALRLGPGQERFVTTVADSLEEADEHPRANPWFRAVYADGMPVGFVMSSWDVEPQPHEINGPWFLWKLLIDHRHQGKGYGREVVQQVVELVRGQGATELLTSHVPGEGGPAGFYDELGSSREAISTRTGRSSCGWTCVTSPAAAGRRVGQRSLGPSQVLFDAQTPAPLETYGECLFENAGYSYWKRACTMTRSSPSTR